MRAIWKRLKQTFWKRSAERELEAEFQFHLEMQVEENLARGMSPEQARLEARRAFGGVEQVKESYRDRRGFRALDSLLQDVRFGLRSLRRNPGFTAVAVLTMALGIGANTAVFSVVNAVIMRPLRFPDPDRLMVILSADKHGSSFLSAAGVYLDWKDRARTFESVAGARRTQMVLDAPEQAHYISVALASPEFFHLIAAVPVSGRAFLPGEDQPGQEFVALVSEEFWRRELGEGPDVLRKTLVLNDAPYRVVGVLPQGTRFANFGAVDVWLPFAANREFRGGGDVVVIGRLRSGATVAAAQSEMDAVMRQIRRERQEDSQTYVDVRPLHDWMIGDVQRSFLMLLGAVSFVLLICCANVANLLLARSTARQKEIAIRAALGAGRARLVAQTLIESLLIAVCGGAIGALLAAAAVRAVPAIRAFAIPRVDEIGVDLSFWAVATALALASGITFGLAPALQTGRRDVAVALHQGDAPSIGRMGGVRLRSALVVVQLALSLILLTGAGLMANTLLRLLTLDLGFERDRLLVVTTWPPLQRYNVERTAEFQLKLAQEVRRLPWARKVTVADNPPLEAVFFPVQIRKQHGNAITAQARHVGPGYFGVTGIPLMAGRDFEPADNSRVPIPVFLDSGTASALFPGEQPVGKQLLTNYRTRRKLEVIGIVGESRQLGVTQKLEPQIYFPALHGYTHRLLIRTGSRPGDVAPTLRQIVHNLDPAIPPPEVTTLDETFFLQIAKPRFYLLVLGGLAAGGLFLAAIGAYGVMSYMVARRTREFGIRMALGAAPADVLRLAMNTGLRLVIVGVILGLAGAAASVRVLSSLLFGVEPLDPLTFSATAVLLAGVGLAACYAAARKATRADANVALRCE